MYLFRFIFTETILDFSLIYTYHDLFFSICNSQNWINHLKSNIEVLIIDFNRRISSEISFKLLALEYYRFCRFANRPIRNTTKSFLFDFEIRLKYVPACKKRGSKMILFLENVALIVNEQSGCFHFVVVLF